MLPVRLGPDGLAAARALLTERRGAVRQRTGEQLAGSLEIGATLEHVAEILVPRFADHCFIDLFQGDALICRVRRHVGDWTPPPGTWKQVGEQIVYPEGTSASRRWRPLDTVIVSDLPGARADRYPASPWRQLRKWG